MVPLEENDEKHDPKTKFNSSKNVPFIKMNLDGAFNVLEWMILIPHAQLSFHLNRDLHANHKNR